MPIRYHLDESVNIAVAHGLRQRGIDVTTASDVGLTGATDKDHLKYARSNDRVIVAHDDDFLRLAASGMVHAGITDCHQRDRTIGQIVLSLTYLWRTESAENLRGQVSYL